MLRVLVQIMGPVEAAPGSYDWTTAGRIDEPESIDSDYLRGAAMKCFGSDYEPRFDVIRFVVVRNGIVEMKIMLTDCFKQSSLEKKIDQESHNLKQSSSGYRRTSFFEQENHNLS